jgi:hypothetical protein
VHLDISTIKPHRDKDGKIVGQMNKPNWRLIVDAKSRFKISDFFATKDGRIEPTLSLFHEWKNKGHPVTHLCMDNAGENLKLMERAKSSDWKLGIHKFELTARDTPQQNALAEVGFDTLGNRARAMLHRANVPDTHRHLLFGKAVETATKLDGLVVEVIDGVAKMRVEHAGYTLPSFAKSLQTWGEAGVVKLKTDTTPKILAKGTTCVFVGYPDNHGAGTWLMYNPQTKGVHTTRDVVFLKCMYWSRKGPDLKEIMVNKETSETVGTNEAGERNDEPGGSSNVNTVQQIVKFDQDGSTF